MDLSDHTVLVIEDQYLVALEVIATVEEGGARPLGPVASVKEALDIVHTEHVDLGLVDINLEGEFSYPAVDALLESGAAVILMSGYDPSTIPEKYRHLPFLPKPLTRGMLLDRLRQLWRPG